ncbi:RNA polymerase sigma factor [Sphingomonas sp. CFBP 13728]|nr:RNA polymerase sigma factor [Sphingomonas sp. CFBP 13728]
MPDLVQETFARLIAAKASETCRRPAAYLQRMARNLLIDQSRRPHTRLARFHVSIDHQCEVTGQPEQGHAIEADDALRMYGQVLAALPDRTRHVFTLHRVDGLGYKAIGERLGISVPTVQSPLRYDRHGSDRQNNLYPAPRAHCTARRSFRTRRRAGQQSPF